MNPTPLAFGEQGGFLLQIMKAFPPIPEVKLVPQDVPGPQGPQADGKGA